jgi:hypothetical protein
MLMPTWKAAANAHFQHLCQLSNAAVIALSPADLLGGAAYLATAC